MYTNADSLMNKRTELDALIELHKPAVIGIVEVKPKNFRYKIQECEIAINGYDIFHNLDEEGRGICLYVKHELKPALLELDQKGQECIFTRCNLVEGESLVLGLVYRSPSSSSENNEKLNRTLMDISDTKPTHVAIVGDFNYPEINWAQERSNASENHPATKFYKATKDSFLIQHQMQPTRYRDGQNPTLDDLVLTNREDIVHEINITGALGKSDHVTLLVNLAVSGGSEEKHERPNYHKANYEGMSTFFERIEWRKEFEDKNVNLMWTTFKDKVEDAKSKYVPNMFVGGRKKKKWLDKGTLTTVRKKHRLYSRWLETKSGKDYQDYKKALNKATKQCRKAKRKMEATVADQAKSNPKSFWSYVKSKTGTRTGIPDLKMNDGKMATTDKEKADTLNEFFQSVFTHEPLGDLPKPPYFELDSELSDIDITREDVVKQLKKLNTGKAAGMDGIPPLLLVETADALALPISMIFKKSLEEGCIPNDWRKAKVAPIYKNKGSRSSTNNYRPVSLTSVLCKTMETLVRGKMITHLKDNNLICDQQHGFTSGRSCVTQLLDTLDCWTEILDRGESVDVVYMDFRKAFDSVPHRRLMKKVEAHGIRGRVYEWTQNFLTNRTQEVTVNGVTSAEAAVTSGIPQGSVLGPLLFIMYINDLPDHVENEVRIFADDTKIFKEVQRDDKGSLQEDLDRLFDWSRDWLLSFHPEKCCFMRIGQSTVDTSYSMKEMDNKGDIKRHRLAETEAERDLGVTIDNKLSFKNHIAQATAKANSRLGVIRRSFDFLTEKTFVQLYKSMVRPILEYAQSVWQPQQKMLRQDLEDVQRRATKMIAKIKEKPYNERLEALKLPSLEHRRKRGDMIEVFKYTSGINKTERPALNLHSGRVTRGHCKKLSKERCLKEIRRKSFPIRVVSTWNDLPEHVVTAPTVNAFKNRLDKHWRHLPTMYNPDCYSVDTDMRTIAVHNMTDEQA